MGKTYLAGRVGNICAGVDATADVADLPVREPGHCDWGRVDGSSRAPSAAES